MNLTQENIEALHRKYAPNDELFELIYVHCRIVADIALWCADNCGEPVDTELLEQACLVHDIGAYGLLRMHDFEYRVYVQHAILGARILEDEGVDQRIADMVATHIVMGVTKDEIRKYRFMLPAKDYIPKAIEAELLAYADKFHSKNPQFNLSKTTLAKYEEFQPTQVSKFKSAMKRFGVPDLENLAKQYGHPVK